MAAIDQELKGLLSKAAKEAFDLDLGADQIQMDRPKRKNQGDFATNLAMQLARELHKNPMEIAGALKAHISDPIVDNIEVARPGFMNFTISTSSNDRILKKVLSEKENYGQLPPKGIKVNLEYVSANPTGSLHLGHARGAAWGDSAARIMKKAGYDVTREYYVNDAGNQINNLMLSLQARYLQALGKEAEIGPDGYLGKDIEEMGKAIAEKYGDALAEDTPENRQFFRSEGIRFELDKIRRDLKDFGVEFDVWSSEQDIRDAKKPEAALKVLEDNGYLYEDDGALWFKTTAFDDDKDRVLRKKDGSYTYLVPDIAYHNNKYERGFDVIVDFLGADHHGYIPRLKASMEALGNDPDKLNVDIIQMVRLVRGGEEVVMSKRLGNATTLKDLVDETGSDAARYFFVARSLDTHLDFDLDLAMSQSNDNPVYYAQYAHARMCSILKGASDIEPADKFDLLTDEKEVDLIHTLQDFENVVEDTARTRKVHRMTHYIQSLAGKFHSFYNANKVIDANNPELSAQRLALVQACRIVLANALNLIGVNAVESM